jgi:hypothetical protein
MQSWALRSQKTSTLSYVSLILTPSDNGTGWLYGPRFSAWHTYADGRPNHFVCSRAKVIEG